MVNLPRDHGALTLNLRVSPKIRAQLEKLSDATGKTKSFLATEAINNYLSVQSWQIHDTKQAVKKADAKDAKFIDHHKVVQWVNSWDSEDESGISE